MIKRKLLKKITKRKSKHKQIRKNPYIDDYFINKISKVIEDPSPSSFLSLKIYYNHGEECKDCGERNEYCQCEQCPDCEFNRCLCDLDITKTEYFKLYENGKNMIKKKKLELDILSLTLKIVQKAIDNTNNKDMIEELNFQKRRIESEILYLNNFFKFHVSY